MAKVYIGLGSNIEPRRFFINSAIKEINRQKEITLKKRSTIYNTYPVGDSSQERFLNSVIEIDTSLRPRELLLRLLKIENSLGRIRFGKNNPRTIDLDILLYDNLVINDDNLVIPHPRMHNRDFVLFGINEIAPYVIHPVFKRSIREIYNKRRMEIIRDPKKAYNYIFSLKQKGRRIGFVPTMGYFHKGHLSLIRKARHENDVVVVSIFVNPIQFGPREDYKRYPRDLSRDKTFAKKEGVDFIFYPDEKTMYALNHSTYVNVEDISENLCGRFRPGHFRGVATVVTKLFNIIPADNAYFGQKDAQQAFIIRRMVRDLDMPLKVKILPTVREKDGLAMSSRNTYLNKKEKQEATVLFESLLLAKDLIRKGKRRANEIIRRMKDLITSKASAKIEYISIVDTEELKDLKVLKGNVLIALAVYFGKTRLIDNIIMKV
jgi:pantoate--beta-alanine ligase